MAKRKDISSQEPLFTRQDVADRWQQSTETVKRRERAGMLHPLKLGRSMRYRLSDILSFEKASEV
jgi:hypothetical protein